MILIGRIIPTCSKWAILFPEFMRTFLLLLFLLFVFFFFLIKLYIGCIPQANVILILQNFMLYVKLIQFLHCLRTITHQKKSPIQLKLSAIIQHRSEQFSFIWTSTFLCCKRCMYIWLYVPSAYFFKLYSWQLNI